MDFYDVSLVNGYNLPVLLVPQGGAGGACSSTGCLVNLNGHCPADLRVVLPPASGDGAGEAVACRSACDAFGSPEYCCIGAYGNRGTCKPSSYSQFFKNGCPRADSYAYDDATSTFTCAAAANYLITFCPSTTSQKSTGSIPQAAGITSSANGTMVYMSGDTAVGASHSMPRIEKLLAFAVALAFFLGF